MSCSCPATDYAAPICIGPLVTGDEWDGRQFTVQVRNPNFDPTLPVSSTNLRFLSASTAYADLARVILQVHTSASQLDTLVERDSDDSGQITIDDATDWIFTVDPYTFTLAAGTYFVGIACQETGGGWKTFAKGTLTLTGKGVVVA